jgi:nitrogenase subunit NifH
VVGAVKSGAMSPRRTGMSVLLVRGTKCGGAGGPAAGVRCARRGTDVTLLVFPTISIGINR